MGLAVPPSRRARAPAGQGVARDREECRPQRRINLAPASGRCCRTLTRDSIVGKGLEFVRKQGSYSERYRTLTACSSTNSFFSRHRRTGYVLREGLTRPGGSSGDFHGQVRTESRVRPLKHVPAEPLGDERALQEEGDHGAAEVLTCCRG